MVVIEQDPNARFEKAIFNLLRSFNFVDINIGYLIASIPSQNSRQERIKKLANQYPEVLKVKQNLRRNLLKGLAVSVPATWAKPVVNTLILPAHAVTSLVCSGAFTDVRFYASITGSGPYVLSFDNIGGEPGEAYPIPTADIENFNVPNFGGNFILAGGVSGGTGVNTAGNTLTITGLNGTNEEGCTITAASARPARFSFGSSGPYQYVGSISGSLV